MIRRIRLLLLLLLCVSCEVALSQQATAHLQGIVVDSGTGTVIPKATVDLRIPGTRDAAATTRSDRDGKFYLPNVKAGSYRFVVTHEGHVTANKTLKLAAGQTVSDMRVGMTAGGVISGRITDKGKPIGLADAVAVRAIWTEGQPSLVPVISVRTDDTGEFNLFWLPPGRYFVIGIVWDTANSLGYFINPEDEDNGNFQAQRFIGRAVFMRATAGGIADNEAHVPTYYPGTTDPQMAKAIEVQPGGVIRGIDIDATAVRTGRVRGRVLGGTGQARATVEMVPLISGFITSTALRPTATADATGLFEMNTVAPGRYVLTARTADAIGRTFVEVQNRDVPDVVVSLSARFSLAGRVITEGPVPPGMLSSLRVALRSDPLLPNTTNTGVPVKPDGTFVIPDSTPGSQSPPGIPPGDYRVLVTPILSPPATEETLENLPNAYVKSIRLGDVDVLNERLRLQSPPQDPLTIVIGTRFGSLEGRIVDQKPGATIVLMRDDGMRYRVNERFTFSDDSGRFEFPNVAPGNYKLFAWERVERGAWLDPEFMRSFESRGVPVRIEEGGKASVNATLIER